MSETKVINGAAPEQPSVTPQQAAEYQTALMAIMPGLVGGIGEAIKEQMNHPVAFVLVTFGPGGASYATNITDQEIMKKAVGDLVDAWRREQPAQPLQPDDAMTLHAEPGEVQ